MRVCRRTYTAAELPGADPGTSSNSFSVCTCTCMHIAHGHTHGGKRIQNSSWSHGYQGAALAFSEFDVLKRQLVETLLCIYAPLLAE